MTRPKLLPEVVAEVVEDESEALVPKPSSRGDAEKDNNDDPSAPAIGRWFHHSTTTYDYEVAHKDVDVKWLCCVTHIGSNYAQVTYVGGSSERIHFDDWFKSTEREYDPDTVIGASIEEHKTEALKLMNQVQVIAARLSIGIGTIALTPGADETSALVRHSGSNQPMNEYKEDLILAKDKTLPELFEQIQKANEKMGLWMGAKLIPLKAQVRQLEPAIEAIENRIFSVELYAGLTEKITQIKEGEPAPVTEPIRLFQRRCYMDEECLAQYRTGGMRFEDLKAFDAWFVEPANLARLLPFPRCVVAFQVRRERKHHAISSFGQFIRLMFEKDMDDKTFLYMRNGDQVFRLNTAIDFGPKLFPDLDGTKLVGKLYAKKFGSRLDSDKPLITEHDYKERRRAYALAIARHKKYERDCIAARKKGLKEDDEGFPPWQSHFIDERDIEDYVPYEPGNIMFDDISAKIQAEITEHNRIVLVLQGVLDRSPVFHPHPPWQLGTPAGFETAIRLVYDESRALVAGEKPDFEAYRARLNASLKPGDATVGQDDAWARREGARETERCAGRGRGDRFVYEHYRPYGDPGPGYQARVVSVSKKGQSCTFEWTRKRRGQATYWNKDKDLNARITVPMSELLNISAYKAGDFKQFFDDPRTRAEYLHWAPYLLEAEEFVAGNRTPESGDPGRKNGDPIRSEMSTQSEEDEDEKPSPKSNEDEDDEDESEEGEEGREDDDDED